MDWHTHAAIQVMLTLDDAAVKPSYTEVTLSQTGPESDKVGDKPRDKAGLDTADRSFAGHTPKPEISIRLEPQGGGLLGRIDAGAGLFEPETIERLAGHFKTLLDGVIADPECRISRLPLLTAAERIELLHEWNKTAAEFCSDKCIHELFEEQVERTPERVAVVCQDQQVTFRELNERANGLARSLRKLGVGPEVRVGVCMRRSIEMVVALYAIHKAGGAYVPIDPGYPQERIDLVLEDAQVALILTGVTGDECQVTRHASLVTRHASRKPVPDNLAYVIYTSGSTGRPKGVMVRHRDVITLHGDRQEPSSSRARRRPRPPLV